jgi:hypothetical protein
MCNVGFEVFAAVVMKSIILWDMTPCSPLSFNRRFGGKYRLHLQGRRNKFSKNQEASRWKAKYVPDFRLADYSACHLLAFWFLLNLFLRP